MLPAILLPQLSPNAAKILLCLLTLQDPSFQTPNAALISTSIQSLAQLSALAPRTCRRALAELRTLRLLSSLPRKYHQPATHLLVLTPTPLPQQSRRPARTPAFTVPSTPPSSHPIPAPTPKKPTLPPQAPLLTPNPVASPDPADALLNPPLLSLLMALMPDDQKSQLLATAQSTLARLDVLTPKTPPTPSAMMPDSSSA